MECDSGMQDAADATMEVAKTLNEKISKYCLVTIETCAYAGRYLSLRLLSS
jgi:26S proteasome regulatory subunit N1